MHAWTTATGFTDVFLKRQFHVLVIGRSTTPLYWQKHQRRATGNRRPIFIIHVNVDEPSNCSADTPVHEAIIVIHHKLKIDRLYQMQEHVWEMEKHESRLRKGWSEQAGLIDIYKQHGDTLFNILSNLLKT